MTKREGDLLGKKVVQALRLKPGDIVFNLRSGTMGTVRKLKRRHGSICVARRGHFLAVMAERNSGNRRVEWDIRNVGKHLPSERLRIAQTERIRGGRNPAWRVTAYFSS